MNFNTLYTRTVKLVEIFHCGQDASKVSATEVCRPSYLSRRRILLCLPDSQCYGTPSKCYNRFEQLEEACLRGFRNYCWSLQSTKPIKILYQYSRMLADKEKGLLFLTDKKRCNGELFFVKKSLILKLGEHKSIKLKR